MRPPRETENKTKTTKTTKLQAGPRLRALALGTSPFHSLPGFPILPLLRSSLLNSYPVTLIPLDHPSQTLPTAPLHHM
jgi:hypothetical protein